MNVAFVANRRKGVFFHAVAPLVASGGHEVHWATPSAKWAAWLRDQGVAAERIFDVTEHGSEWVEGGLDDERRRTVRRLERASGTTIRDTILQDRVLRRKPFERAIAYLAVTAERFEAFARAKDIEAVFGEQTWAFELSVGQVCRAMDVPLFVPRGVRIPDGRFGFFRGATQASLVELSEPTEGDRKAARSFLHAFRRRRPRPRYFHLNERVPTPSWRWLLKPFERIGDPYDETRFQWRDLPNYASQDLKEVVNASLTALRSPFDLEEPPDGPFLFVTLHRQPEASVDVLGAYVSNQLETVRAVARSVPASHAILVKEHSNAIGDRGPGFYSDLRSIPGVHLVDPHADTFAFLEEADLVFSISGTACYEAALLGRRAVTAAPMFFGPLLVRNGWNPYDGSGSEMTGWLEDEYAAPGDATCVDFLAGVFANSFEGRISDPGTDESCMEAENLERVASGFLELLSHPTASRPAPG